MEITLVIKTTTATSTTSMLTTTHGSTSTTSRFFTTSPKPTTTRKPTTTDCVDLHDSCAEFDLVYGFCQAPPGVSPLLYKQAHEECRRTCNFC